MINHFENYNKTRVEKEYNKKKIVIGSMDIEKWYPNTLAEPSAKIVSDMMVESELEFKDNEDVGK